MVAATLSGDDAETAVAFTALGVCFAKSLTDNGRSRGALDRLRRDADALLAQLRLLDGQRAALLFSGFVEALKDDDLFS
ncbi:hypothetical protein SAMN05216548_112105 [Faunimonas pinastri]|uniref:Uncharacterized protein n=1 Tax=Faunimonas pinastri TaxID=1855383 RepID=A0A1H9M2M4_9HYPH|nr:hypothetical protein [Faunimonas pinastri]SER17735.1 hypothetical protein SAMN05216548_112105 [Faunimonas pinastri]